MHVYSEVTFTNFNGGCFQASIFHGLHLTEVTGLFLSNRCCGCSPVHIYLRLSLIEFNGICLQVSSAVLCRVTSFWVHSSHYRASNSDEDCTAGAQGTMGHFSFIKTNKPLWNYYCYYYLDYYCYYFLHIITITTILGALAVCGLFFRVS